jgi:protein arginine N-methyltransferase 2
MLNDKLLHACQTEADAEVWKDFIEKGAFAFMQDSSGWTALHYAAARQDASLVTWLLQNGAVWNITDHSGLASRGSSISLPSLTLC